MALVNILLFMFLCLAVYELYESPMCGDCGKRLVHARDCRHKR